MSGLQVVLNPNVLVPDLNAVVFQTELGGSASLITQFSPPAGANSTWSFGLFCG